MIFNKFFKLVAAVFLLMQSSLIFSQVSIKESDVPKPVKTRFIKKFKDVQKAAWSKADTSYIATFRLDKRIVKCYISHQGYWQRNVYYLTNAETPPAALNYIKKNFTNNTFNIYKWEIVNEDVIYFVQIYDEKSKQLINHLYFSKTGKFLRSEEVEIIEYTEPEVEKTSKSIKEIDDKLLSDTMDILYNDEINDKPTKINSKELPSPILDYLSKNFKEEKITKSLLYNNKQLSYYLIEVKKEGQKVSTKLKFDLKGNFIDYQN